MTPLCVWWIPSVASSCSLLLFYFVCCSTGVGDVVQDRHDPICFVLSSVCCSAGVGDAVQDRHDFIVCLVGPVCGFVMLDVVVLFCLSCVVYLALVNLVAMFRIDLTPMDPRWVGAWWIPFLICGVVMLILVLPLAGYPAKLPGTCVLQLRKLALRLLGTNSAI